MVRHNHNNGGYMTDDSQGAFRRKEAWVPTPRPEWVKILNEQASHLDMASVVPLDFQSLIDQAVRNSGLTDFGDDAWLGHFKVLMTSIEEEANLHFAGRILTRYEFVRYLEIRLSLVDWLKREPAILDQTIDRPVIITGFGRSGTTILYEVLSQDPQFRVPLKWEALFPVPPPETASYHSDPRITRTEGINSFQENLIPEMKGMHKSAATLPVESVELVYFTFLSEVFTFGFQVPSYVRYLETQDLGYCFEWQKKLLKLLQWRHRGNHWLLKGPSHLPYMRELLGAFPDARIIFTHRDPIVSADSVVSLQASLYWWRTDTPWGDGSLDNWVIGSAQTRASLWDDIIAMLDDGTLDKRQVSNFQYREFMADPMAAVRGIYRDFDLELTPEVEARMVKFLADKPQGKFGKHEYQHAPDEVIRHERAVYSKYQAYFSVPNEL